MQTFLKKDAFHRKVLELIETYGGKGKGKQRLADRIGVNYATVHRWSQGDFVVEKVHQNNYLAIMGSLPSATSLATPTDTPELAAHLAAVRQILTAGEPWMVEGLIANIRAFSGYLELKRKGASRVQQKPTESSSVHRSTGRPYLSSSHGDESEPEVAG